MKKVILIDMENMQHQGYQGLESLNKEFEVVFFESAYTVEIPQLNLAALDQVGVQYSFEWVNRNPLGKDTMDFCMVAYLALRSSLAQEPENYFILSKDSDFNIPSSYISGKVGIEVKVIKSIKAVLDKFDVEYKQITPEDIIKMCMAQAESLHELHNLLQKTLKKFYSSSEIGGIYRNLVSDFKRKS